MAKLPHLSFLLLTMAYDEVWSDTYTESLSPVYYNGKNSMAFCPNCSSEISTAATACNKCGANFSDAGGWKPLQSLSSGNTGAAGKPGDMPYNMKAGRILRLFGWIGLFLGGLGALAIVIPSYGTEHFGFSVGWGLFLIGVPIFQLYLGAAMKAGKKWAKPVGLLYSLLLLLGFPLGTMVGAYILYCLVKWNNQDAVAGQP